MKIRTKLLLILLVTSILPMVIVRGTHAISTFQLRNKIDRDMRAGLTADAERDLEQVVGSYARYLNRDAQLAFSLLDTQAAEVERRLSQPVPQQHPTIYHPGDFHPLTGSAPELIDSFLHGEVETEGGMQALTVSYGAHTTVHAAGIDANDVADDAKRLADLHDSYGEIYERVPDTILWQYTAFENGLHTSYPGKSAYPDDFDARLRPWYTRTIQNDAPIRHAPIVDMSTKQVVMTLAQPVRNASGEVVGVTALDVPLSRVLDNSAIKTTWASHASIAIVSPFGLGAGASISREGVPVSPGLYIAADLGQDYRVRTSENSDARVVAVEDDKVRRDILDDMIAGVSGVQQTRIDGREVMFAYGPIAGDSRRQVYAAITVPVDEVTREAEMIVADVSQEITASLISCGLVVVLLFVVVIVVAWRLSGRITRPVVALSATAQQIAGGDLEARLGGCEGPDELGQMAKAFNAMVPKLRDRMKVRESLALAMEVQQSLLPEVPPEVPGIEIAGHSVYCDETGGDYYDFIQLDTLGPRSVALAVGDVTGHGIAAALLMATGRALIRARTQHDGSLAEVFGDVNRHLCESQFTGRFMTLFYMIVNSTEDESTPGKNNVAIRYLSAGHDPTLVYHPESDTFTELAGNDIPLGIERDWAFHEHKAEGFEPGAVLVAGTDGIWECFSEGEKQFGKDRLREAIRASASKSANEISQSIHDEVQAWRGTREQSDDITLVVVKVV